MLPLALRSTQFAIAKHAVCHCDAKQVCTAAKDWLVFRIYQVRIFEVLNAFPWMFMLIFLPSYLM